MYFIYIYLVNLMCPCWKKYYILQKNKKHNIDLPQTFLQYTDCEKLELRSVTLKYIKSYKTVLLKIIHQIALRDSLLKIKSLSSFTIPSYHLQWCSFLWKREDLGFGLFPSKRFRTALDDFENSPQVVWNITGMEYIQNKWCEGEQIIPFRCYAYWR